MFSIRGNYADDSEEYVDRYTFFKHLQEAIQKFQTAIDGIHIGETENSEHRQKVYLEIAVSSARDAEIWIEGEERNPIIHAIIVFGDHLWDEGLNYDKFLRLERAYAHFQNAEDARAALTRKRGTQFGPQHG